MSSEGGTAMGKNRPILELGKKDQGRLVSSEEFAEANFDEPWRYECEGGKLLVLPPSGGEHVDLSEPWRDLLVMYKFNVAKPGTFRLIANYAWMRIDKYTDRIGDIAIYFASDRQSPPIPDRIPEMVYEFIAPDRESETRDYVVKRADYQRFGVREYAIIDGFRQIVSVLSFGPGGVERRILTVDQVYESPLLPGFSIRLSDVF
jgi:Uma2 family endonuclease